MTAARVRRPTSARAFDAVEGLESYRFPSNLPPSRTASRTTSSVRTPLNSDLQTNHDRPFENDTNSFRNNFAPMRRASSAGRALHLTLEEREKLRDLAGSLLSDVVTAYETHVHVNNRQVNPSEWKLVKKRDHLVAYKQKQKGWSKLVGNANETPTMMAFGSIAGQLDDIMYGFLSETSLDMKLQGSYSGGTIHDAAVLATIDAASLEEPFQFTGVKWVLQNIGSSGSSSAKSASAKTLMKRRDLMYLESVGVTTMESGELVGFRILHSVNFKSMAHLNDHAVRAKISLSQLYRQRSDGKTVDVFMRGYFDPNGGRVSQMMATSLSADVMLQSPGDALECANLKKLTWCAKQSGRRRRKLTAIMRQTRKASAADLEEMRAAAEELGMNPDGEQDASSSCSLCQKDCSGLLRRSACACMVCSQLVCTRCSVIKKLSFAMGPSMNIEATAVNQPSDDGSEEIRQKSLSFCLHCIVASNRERAFDIAVNDLLERGITVANADQFEAVPPAAPSTGWSTPASRPPTTRARPSSVGHQNDERHSQVFPTIGSGRRRATTTSGKRLTTALTFGALAPSNEAAGASNSRVGRFPIGTRGKAFSVASGVTTNSSSVQDAEEVD